MRSVSFAVEYGYYYLISKYVDRGFSCMQK